MSDSVPNNPAGRLHHLLHQAASKNNNRTFREVWAEVLGVDPKDTGRLLSLLADILHQIQEGSQAVSSSDVLRDDLFLTPFRQLEKAFSVINLDAKWQGWKKGHLQADTLVRLEYTAENLRLVYPEGEVDRDELEELREEIEQLISEVRESEISSDLKKILLDGLEHVRRAIVEYDIRGAQGLKRALEQNFGTIILHQKALASDEQAHSFTTRWLEKLQMLKIHMDVAWRFDQLAGSEVGEMIRGLLDKA